MSFRSLTILLFACFFFRPLKPVAQEPGLPFFKYFSPKEYDASTQNWDAVQGKDGLMYFGNGEGILVYDGSAWETIDINKGETVRALAIDSLGTIYFGSKNDFGFLKTDKAGKLSPVFLKEMASGKLAKTEDTWQVLATSHGVYFNLRKAIARWDGTKLSVFQTEKGVSKLFEIDGNVVADIAEEGLCALDTAGKLSPIPGSGFFRDKKPRFLLPWGKHKYLVGTQGDGLFEHTGTTDGFTEIKPFSEENLPLLKKLEIYRACIAPNGNLVLATRSKGLLVLDRKGKIVRRFNEHNGFKTQKTYELFIDKEKNIWLALEKGIMRIDLFSPFSSWNEEFGFEDKVRAVSRGTDGRIYAGSSLGLAFLNENGVFEKIEGISAQSWCHVYFKDSLTGYEALILGTSDGAFEARDKKAVLLSDGKTVYKMLLSKKYPGRIYLAGDGTLAILERKNGGWEFLPKVASLQTEIRDMAEDARGLLWMRSEDDKLFRAKWDTDDKKDFPSVKKYDKDAFLKKGQNRLFSFQGKMYLATGAGLFYLDEKTELFLPATEWGNDFASGKITVEDWEPVDANSAWADLGGKKGGSVKRLYFENGKLAKSDGLVFERIKDLSLRCMFHDKDSVLWLGSVDGLFRFDEKAVIRGRPAFKALIRRVLIGEDSVLFYGYSQQKPLKEAIHEYNFNSAGFRFSAPSFFDEKSTLYSHYLDGYDKNWSEWGNQVFKEYTNLPAGKYVFRVKAKNVFGDQSEPASFPFTVLPPWYQTVWAYLAYTALSVLLLRWSFKMNRRRLEAEKIKLEKIVLDRTEEIQFKNVELEQQKEEMTTQSELLKESNSQLTNSNADLQKSYFQIEEQKGEIEKKSKNITASINYAQRIQSAILPELKDFKNAFSDFFIFFQPRDTVSGDFYWFSTLVSPADGKTYHVVAVADCTGHGVPGAFMSLIGNDVLHSVINHDKTVKPAKILESVHNEVVKILHQNATDNQDGMDMAVCVVEENPWTLHFAGARRPLVYFSKEGAHQLKGSKKSIGGAKQAIEGFFEYAVPLEEGMAFYLFSDGYQDQFGGPEDGKFMLGNLKKLLSEIQPLEMPDQGAKLESEINDWMAHTKQIDDILILGFKVKGF